MLFLNTALLVTPVFLSSTANDIASNASADDDLVAYFKRMAVAVEKAELTTEEAGQQLVAHVFRVSAGPGFDQDRFDDIQKRLGDPSELVFKQDGDVVLDYFKSVCENLQKMNGTSFSESIAGLQEHSNAVRARVAACEKVQAQIDALIKIFTQKAHFNLLGNKRQPIDYKLVTFAVQISDANIWFFDVDQLPLLKPEDNPLDLALSLGQILLERKHEIITHPETREEISVLDLIKQKTGSAKLFDEEAVVDTFSSLLAYGTCNYPSSDDIAKISRWHALGWDENIHDNKLNSTDYTAKTSIKFLQGVVQ
jgi:hypothetical protein